MAAAADTFCCSPGFTAAADGFWAAAERFGSNFGSNLGSYLDEVETAAAGSGGGGGSGGPAAEDEVGDVTGIIGDVENIGEGIKGGNAEEERTREVGDTLGEPENKLEIKIIKEMCTDIKYCS